MKPSSSPATEKTKSVCWYGMNPPWVWRPSKSPWPCHPPEPIGDAHLPRLVPDPLRVGLRVGEGHEPVALVLAQHGCRQGHHHPGHHEGGSPGEPPLRRAGQRDHPEGQGGEHQGRPEVGLQQHQADGHSRHQCGEHDVAVLRHRPAVEALPQDDRQAHAQGGLGELRGLDGEAARQQDPRVRPVDRGPDWGQDQHQTGHRQQVQRGGDGPQQLVPGAGHRHCQRHPEGGVQQVPIEVCRAGVMVRRRPHEEGADEGEPQGPDDQAPVAARPGPGLHRPPAPQRTASLRSQEPRRPDGARGHPRPQDGTMEVSTRRHCSMSPAIAVSSSSMESNLTVGRMCSTNSTETSSS